MLMFALQKYSIIGRRTPSPYLTHSDLPGEAVLENMCFPSETLCSSFRSCSVLSVLWSCGRLQGFIVQLHCHQWTFCASRGETSTIQSSKVVSAHVTDGFIFVSQTHKVEHHPLVSADLFWSVHFEFCTQQHCLQHKCAAAIHSVRAQQHHNNRVLAAHSRPSDCIHRRYLQWRQNMRQP